MKSMLRALALLLALLICVPSALAELPEAQGDAPLPEAAAPETVEDALPGEIEAVDAADPDDAPALEDVDAAGAELQEALSEETPELDLAEDPLAEAAGEAPLTGEEAPLEEAPLEEDFDALALEGEAEEAVLPDGGADNEELFTGYVARSLGLVSLAENRHVGLDLSGANGRLYRQLASMAVKVAGGSRTDTTITFTPADLGVSAGFSRDALGVSDAHSAGASAISAAMGLSFKLVVDTLTADYPYEMYWFNKTQPSSIIFRFKATQTSLKVTSILVRMPVCAAYAAGTYTLNTGKLDQVKAASVRARSIVAAYQGTDDAARVRGYVAEIGRLVRYNSAAAATTGNYGDPWQLVWVFDNDDTTNVVCEGYAKALKYLCDLTAFKGDVFCYTVTGTVSGAANGAHMWNVITMPDGQNYLADPTLTDSGASGLVLMPPTQIISAGSSYYFSAGGRGVTYTYDATTKAVYRPATLTLCAAAYAGSDSLAVQGVSLGGTVRLVVGEKKTLVPSYSPAGANPRKLTWSSSNSKVATVSASGVVKAKKAGTAVITVRTYNEHTAKVTVKVGKKVKPKAVKLNRKGTVTVNLGTRLNLAATLSPWNARSSLKWKSSNKRVAKVSKKGVVVPVAEGKATITVTTANGKRAKVKVKVWDPTAPNSVRLWYGSTEIANGATAALLAGQAPRITAQGYLNGVADTTHAVRWSTSNKKVLAVTAAGTLLTRGAGKATITVKTGHATKKFQVVVTRNRLTGITPKPTKADILQVSGWALALKSVEVVGTNKVVAEFYFVNRARAKSKGVRNFGITLTAGDGRVLASGTVSKYKLEAKRNAVKTVKIAFTGSKVKNTALNLSDCGGVRLAYSGTLY